MREVTRYCENGGVQLEYLVWFGTARDLPVLLIPGLAAPAAYWARHDDFIELLSGGGARTILAVSPRGTGGSDCPEDGWTPDHYQDDLAALLRAEFIERCHVIGHSVGAFHGLGFALRAPRVVASVTMGDFPPVLPEYGRAWVLRMNAMEPKRFHPDFPRRFAAASRRVDYTARLDELEAPLLVVQGTAAGAFLMDEHLLLLRAAPRLEVLKVDTGHDVFASTGCQGACKAFLRRVDAGANANAAAP
jgi:pimeloyl-ACP methyl ester carboxylesterase